MQIINLSIEKFCDQFSSTEHPWLQNINEYTQTHHAQPHMISGKIQGIFLQMVSWMIRPSRILEIGTFTGYSALCLAEGLTESGVLHTIEINPLDAALASTFIENSPYAPKIKIHVGDAKKIIPEMNEIWDLVFIDADKTGYQEYFNLVFPSVKKNGFILADNIFFHGKIFETNLKNKSAIGILEFNKFIQNCNQIEKLPLSIRDGIYLLRKIEL